MPSNKALELTTRPRGAYAPRAHSRAGRIAAHLGVELNRFAVEISHNI
jgi:hypothetical protein